MNFGALHCRDLPCTMGVQTMLAIQSISEGYDRTGTVVPARELEGLLSFAISASC